MSWYTRYLKNKQSVLNIILLKTCPYSRALADLLKESPRIEKVWVGRGSEAFHSYKKKYNATTFPIVVLVESTRETYIGGYEDVIALYKS